MCGTADINALIHIYKEIWNKGLKSSYNPFKYGAT